MCTKFQTVIYVDHFSITFFTLKVLCFFTFCLLLSLVTSHAYPSNPTHSAQCIISKSYFLAHKNRCILKSPATPQITTQQTTQNGVRSGNSGSTAHFEGLPSNSSTHKSPKLPSSHGLIVASHIHKKARMCSLASTMCCRYGKLFVIGSKFAFALMFLGPTLTRHLLILQLATVSLVAIIVS